MKLKKITSKFIDHPWLDKVLSFIAVILYLYQAYIFAHTLGGTMDEGSYLMKGLLFVSGRYKPFEPYGPWTNKMPLSFIIPGWAQAVFEPGLRTGRYFSIFLAFLLLVGLWLITKRLAGRWPATAVLWIMALTSGNIMYYSTATSQVIVACLLTWSMVFTLGYDRKLWEILVGTILGVMIIFTRQNMAPILPLLILYIFWEHGWEKGFYALLTASLLLIIGHAIYWPNIMRLWAPYLPGSLISQIFPPSASTSTAESIQTLGWSLDSKILVFFEGFRYNFVALIGAIICWILWPKPNNWKSKTQQKVSIFLATTLIILVGVHFYASFILNYCLYCYTGYLTFFNTLGLLLVFNTLPSITKEINFIQKLLIVLLILICTTGIAFSAHQVYENLFLNIQVPRMRNMQFLPGSIELWRFLNNKFGWERDLTGKYISTLIGFSLGILVILFGWVLKIINKSGKSNIVKNALGIFIALGLILTPTTVMSGKNKQDHCGWDVMASYEAVGEHLRRYIEPGSLIYWENDLAPTPLLYISDVEIFPPQLNHWYNYYIGGDPDNLYKNSYWNDILAAQWQEEADYILVSDSYVERLYTQVDITLFDEMTPTEPTIPCEGKSIIHTFKRIR